MYSFMAHSLTWKVLGSEDTHKCLAAVDMPAIRNILKSIDEVSEGKLIGLAKYNNGQQMILLDMLSHLILFSRSRQMSPEKISTIVGIMVKVHAESMSNSYTRAKSYHYMRELMIQHSVQRPPFSCAIFTIQDAHEIDEYILRSYYKHYKMYIYAFVPRKTANVRCLDVGHIHQIPPAGLPALVNAIGEQEWRAKVQERRRDEEAEMMQTEEAFSDAHEEAQLKLRQQLLNNPHFAEGIREQLDDIKKEVAVRAGEQLEELERRLGEIEKKVFDTSHRSESRHEKRRM